MDTIENAFLIRFAQELVKAQTERLRDSQRKLDAVAKAIAVKAQQDAEAARVGCTPVAAKFIGVDAHPEVKQVAGSVLDMSVFRPKLAKPARKFDKTRTLKG